MKYYGRKVSEPEKMRAHIYVEVTSLYIKEVEFQRSQVHAVLVFIEMP